ncbi:hypothetical protein [Viridibacillus arvi]|uniref:hypothetical protein n=1 Tax=Viridibacillus arvi TaxID=263475 RepID=UPI0034CFCFD6
MTEVNSVISEIREKMSNRNMQDKDVWMFETIQCHRKTPFITLILKIMSDDPDCTKELWEEIADICFEILSDRRNIDTAREQALELLAQYRNYLKSNTINMTIEKIPDNILNFERAGRKMHSKLHGTLHGVDLKIMQVQHEEELKIINNDAIMLVAITQKRLEQIEEKKERIECFQKVYKESISRKQMIKIEVVKYREVSIDNIKIPNKQVLFSKSLPFKKSDNSTIKKVNELIKILNREYGLKVQLIAVK